MLRALVFVLVLMLPASAGAQSGAYPIWRVLACPDDPGRAPARSDYDESGCVEQGIHDVDPQRRALWVRARVTIPDNAAPPLAVYVSAMASSEAYWNGRYLGANGRPASAPQDEAPGLMDAEFHLPDALIAPGENLLALRLSGHDMPVRVGTPIHRLGVGQFGALRIALLGAYQPALIASGAILLAAMFFFSAFMLDRREASALWLSLVAFFAVGQLGAEAARGLFAYAYPLHVPRLILVTGFASLFSIALGAFVAARFRIRKPWPWIGAAIALSLLIAPLTPGLDGKTWLALFAGAAVALAMVARAAWAGRAGARVTAAALLGFIALMLLRPGEFLDRDFYLAVSALMGVLSVNQLFAMRRDRAAREAAQRRSAQLELELLRRSLAPHFMMNTLNALAEWVESDSAKGVRMIEALAEHMRALAALGERDAIPLGEEIELVRNYLAVMSYRADAPFSLRVSGDASVIKTPPGLLHTLTENGFSHNRYPNGGEFHLDIATSKARARLLFSTPPSAQRRTRASGGEGCAYVRGRLAASYGEAATFCDGPAEDGGWRSVIEMPAAAP